MSPCFDSQQDGYLLNMPLKGLFTLKGVPPVKWIVLWVYCSLLTGGVFAETLPYGALSWRGMFVHCEIKQAALSRLTLRHTMQTRSSFVKSTAQKKKKKVSKYSCVLLWTFLFTLFFLFVWYIWSNPVPSITVDTVSCTWFISHCYIFFFAHLFSFVLQQLR